MPHVDKIVIVDWSSKIPLEIENTKATILRVRNKSHFDANKARNTGIRYCNTHWIFMIDADIIIQASEMVCDQNPGFIGMLAPQLKPGSWYFRDCSAAVDPSITGTMLFERSAWEKIGGYPENMIGWGFDDSAFSERLLGLGLRRNNIFNQNYLNHIPHGDAKRIDNYPFCAYDKWFGMMINKGLSRCVDYKKQTQQKQVCDIIENGTARTAWI